MKKIYNVINNGFIEFDGKYKSQYGESDTPLIKFNSNINIKKQPPLIIYDIELNLIRTVFDFITKHSENDPIFVFKNNCIFLYFFNEKFDIYIRLQNSWGMYDYIKLLKYKKDIYFSIDKFSIFSVFTFFLEHRNGKFKDINLQVNDYKMKINIDEDDIILHNNFKFNFNHILHIPETIYTDIRFLDIEKILPDEFNLFSDFFQETYFNSSENYIYHKTSSYEFIISKK